MGTSGCQPEDMMDGLPTPRFGLTGVGFIDHGQVMALAGVIARELVSEPDATMNGLALTVENAREILTHYPQLDVIEACYLTGPGECSFCGYHDQDAEVQEVPAWVTQAKAERDSAILTLSAISETTVALSADPAKDGEWLATLYKTDPAGFQRTWPMLATSPGWQEAIAVARKLIFGDQSQAQAPAQPAPLPGGMMAHTLAAGPSQRGHTLGHQRQHLDLEGHHRYHHTGDTIAGDRQRQPAPQEPPPQAEPPPQEDKPRRRRGRRRR
jgi:hypothetical protein